MDGNDNNNTICSVCRTASETTFNFCDARHRNCLKSQKYFKWFAEAMKKEVEAK